MKKTFILFLIAGSVNAFAQDQKLDYKFPRNEFKVNVFYPFVNGAELSYERHLTTKSSVGASVFLELDNFGDSFMFSPYYRRYFSRKTPNSGFFLEGNAMIAAPRNDFHNAISEKGNIMPGLGIQTGYKLQIKKDWFVEANAGTGFLIKNSSFDAKEIFRAGIMIGKRF